MWFYPTFDELVHPEKFPEALAKAAETHRSELLAPENLLNMSWFNGGERSFFMVPRELHGQACDILILSGRHFPSGSHKVGPVYSILREYELDGVIDREQHTAVFPSTGNFGIGGAWVGARMGYHPLVVLPAEMSRERFEMIEAFGGEVIKTPGCESNVKEIYDEVGRLRGNPRNIILNQFEEFGNYRFHYHVTGKSLERVVQDHFPGKRITGIVSAMGSAGTLAAGDYLKSQNPDVAVVGLEPVQCPTLFNLGVGPHRIEGIGDKHVTWVHNVHNTDWHFCIDDAESLAALQLIQENPATLAEATGMTLEAAEAMQGIFGVSGACNLLGAVRTAHQIGAKEGDVIATFATDGFDRYPSVLELWRETHGELNTKSIDAALAGVRRDEKAWVLEGTPAVQTRWHNQKYFTWVEQQGKSIPEWQALTDPQLWKDEAAKVTRYDNAILEARENA